VSLWFKLYRYLTGRNLPTSGQAGKPPLVKAVEESISSIFGLEGADVSVCANIFLTYTMGNEAFGEFLGTTDAEAEAALLAMYNVVRLLAAQNRPGADS